MKILNPFNPPLISPESIREKSIPSREGSKKSPPRRSGSAHVFCAEAGWIGLT